MKKMTPLFLLISCVLHFTSAGAAPAADADSILKATDNLRNPADSYVMRVGVTTSDDETPYEFEVSVKGKEKTLIKTLSPKRDEGKSFLMLGEDMWVSLPTMKRAVRVSLSQKLVGEAANGDIARMRWHGDYEATIEKETGTDWILNLKANKKGLTYDQIKLQVAKAGYRPVHAEFLTSSGKVFKKLTYKGFKKLAGRVRPSELEILNTTTDVKSTIKLLKVEPKGLPDSLFNQNNLN